MSSLRRFFLKKIQKVLVAYVLFFLLPISSPYMDNYVLAQQGEIIVEIRPLKKKPLNWENTNKQRRHVHTESALASLTRFNMIRTFQLLKKILWHFWFSVSSPLALKEKFIFSRTVTAMCYTWKNWNTSLLILPFPVRSGEEKWKRGWKLIFLK